MHHQDANGPEQANHGGENRPSCSQDDIAAHLGAICSLLHRNTGHDFSSYKEGMLVRRVARRMQMRRVERARDYLKMVEQDASEAESLFKDLLISVSYFFRDPDAFDVLGREIIPKFFEGEPSDAPVRIWVPACASGEEAYSIAILVREHQTCSGTTRPAQIFATDIDEEMLAAARKGSYSAGVVQHVSAERLERFFKREDNCYRAGKTLRDLCVFSPHNLVKDPPFSSLSLISCRNLLIYLEEDLQARLMPLFHYALRPGGYLLLGPAEGVIAYPELFAPIEKRLRIFQRKEGVARASVQFPLSGWSASRLPSRIRRPEAGSPEGAPSVSQVFEKMVLEEYAPPCIVVNEQGDILYTAGRTGRYLQLPAGAVSTNILDLVAGSLRLELRAALYRAAQSHRKVVRENLPLESDDRLHQVRLTVRPLPGMSRDSGLFAVILQDVDSPRLVSEEDVASPMPEEPIVQHLESELRIAREDLQNAVQDLESANEELKASNEELLSTNEELQTANEELQTSKEELQSLNEVLETVNAELHTKVHELNAANSDLQNLIAGTQIATVFLDRDLRIKKFTPAATALFHLLEGDVGRPISHLTPRFPDRHLFDDIRRVLDGQPAVERQVRSDDGKSWFILRTLPYRSLEGDVVGVVITFVDVTPLKRAEEIARHHAEQRRLAMEAAAMGSWDYDFAGGEVLWDAACCRLFGLPETQTVTYEATTLCVHPDDRRATDDAVQRAIAGVDDGAYDHQFRVIWPDGSVHWLSGHGRVYFEADGARRRPVRFIGVTMDISERKLAEDQLVYLASYPERNPNPVTEVDLDGHIRYLNPASQRLFPGIRQQGVQHPWFADWPSVVSSLCAQQAVTPVRDVVIGDRVYQQSFYCAEQDRIVRVYGLDVTERYRAEEAMRESSTRLQTIVNSLSEGLVVADLDGRLREWNPAALKMHGFSNLEQARRHLSDLAEVFELSADDGAVLPLDEWPLSRILRGEELRDWAVYIRRLDEDWQRVFSYGGTLIRDSQGQPWLAMVTIEDITERKQAQLAIQDSWNRLGLALEFAKAGTWEWDLQTNENFWSEETWGLYGLNPGEIRPSYEAWRSTVHPDDLARVERAVQAAARNGVELNAEWRAREPSGKERWLMSRGKPLRGAGGQPLRYLGIVIDVTDRRRAEEERSQLQAQVLHAQKLEGIGVLAGGIAHDFNNILAGILGYADVALAQSADSKPLRHSLEVIKKAAGRAADLTRQMLDYAGKGRFAAEPLALSRVIEDIREMLRVAVSKKATLRYELTPDLPAIQADASQVRQVIMNLVINASESLGEHTGEIGIATRALACDRGLLSTARSGADAPEGPYVCLEVSDTGCGMDPMTLAKIFDPFFTTKFAGRGLGLAAVQGIVRGHGGAILVSSEAGSGTTFRVLFPVSSCAPPEPKIQPPPPKRRRGSGTVLVVDDEEIVRMATEALVQSAGFKVLCAADGEEAIEVYRDHRDQIACVILDLTMPKMSGEETLGELRRLDPDVRVILTSGYTEEEMMRRFSGQQVFGFLEKPGSMDLLIEKLQDLTADRPC